MSITAVLVGLSPTGTIRANSFTSATQTFPDVLGLKGGGFVTAYNTLGGSVLLDFHGAGFNRLGDFKVPSAGASQGIGQPSLTQLANGNVLVVWDEDDPGDPGLKGRLFSETGSEIGGELSLTGRSTVPAAPEVAALKGGGFVVAYETGNDILLRRYDDAGAQRGETTLVNTATLPGIQSEASVAALADGGFVVTFTDAGRIGLQLRGAIYDANGTVRKADFPIMPLPDNSQSSVVGLPNGNWAVVWTGTSAQEGGELGNRIMMKILNTEARSVSEFIQVSDRSAVDEVDPDVTVLENGFIVVTWTRGGDIMGRVFDQAGNGLAINGNATEFFIAAKGATEIRPSISGIEGGRFVIAWQDSTSDGSGGRISAMVQDIVRLVTGDGAADLFTGDALRDQVLGRGGNDTLLGAGGNDLLDGGEGDDLLIGGSGNDLLKGGIGHDTLSGGIGDDQLEGGDGDDLLNGGDGNDMLFGEKGNDTLSDGAGNDRLAGGDGDDLLEGGRGVDTLIGGDGNDTIFANSADDPNGAAEGNVMLGGGGNDSIRGGDGNDTIDGGSEFDVIDGGAGNDLLQGGAFGDTLFGGDGNDRLFANIEADPSGSFANDRLIGGAGNDFLHAARGSDTLVGGAGNDTLIGGAASDTLNGGAGFDMADYSADRAGVNINLATGVGLDGDRSTDTLISIEFLVGSAFGDTLQGGAGRNLFLGGDGDDSLDGGAGDDHLEGGAGADTIKGGGGSDEIGAGGGNDLLYGGGGDDFLDARAGNDTVRGGGGNDGLQGAAGNDLLSGDAGDDVLFGGAGDDTLVGGAGADTMFGSNGRDTFVFNRVQDSAPGARDVINNFSSDRGHLIDLAGIDANALRGGNQAFSFIGQAAFSGAAGELRVAGQGDNRLVLGDVDGDRIADIEILVKDVAGLTAEDFIL